MSRIYISIGSNVEPARNIRQARNALARHFAGLELSPVYQTEAIGFDGEDFLNLVAICDTDLDVHDVDAVLDDIEQANGRDRNAPRFAPRTLDLDLLLYDDKVVSTDDLELPRKEILKYAFVLLPLADIAPDVRHPVAGRTFAELLESLELGSQRCREISFSWQMDRPD